jgi:hypothetical protein
VHFAQLSQALHSREVSLHAARLDGQAKRDDDSICPPPRRPPVSILLLLDQRNCLVVNVHSTRRGYGQSVCLRALQRGAVPRSTAAHRSRRPRQHEEQQQHLALWQHSQANCGLPVPSRDRELQCNVTAQARALSIGNNAWLCLELEVKDNKPCRKKSIRFSSAFCTRLRASSGSSISFSIEKSSFTGLMVESD